MVFTYYRYLDKLHVEPVTWFELLTFTDYVATDSSISKLITDSAKQEK